MYSVHHTHYTQAGRGGLYKGVMVNLLAVEAWAVAVVLVVEAEAVAVVRVVEAEAVVLEGFYTAAVVVVEVVLEAV